MSWCIAADSSCNLRSFVPTAPETSFRLAPLKVHVGDREFVDDAQLDVAELTKAIAAEDTATSSSCPSIGEWAEIFRSADNIIAITISARLSGSYEAAQMARTMIMDEYVREHAGSIAGKNIYILNSRAAGGKLEVLVRLLDDYLQQPREFEDAVAFIDHAEESSQVLYSLSRYENLVKSGRMPRGVGSIASKLNIRILGTASSEGTIKLIGSTRGEKKTIKKIVDTMASNGFSGGSVSIDHRDNVDGALGIKEAILQRWPMATVHIESCGGLCSYYAEESGLLIGYEWA
ncbi:DegV family protein [Collinsella sp. D33t1_170424_A12]|uniref:DegV family protein n=1 Tax=Collinsella sp. D33t1_170424_A12 TaxID=2787135 RepID=UPI00189A48F6|nr:DegV family protein [Collinsella sp. D33t1_170424_A12]